MIGVLVVAKVFVVFASEADEEVAAVVVATDIEVDVEENCRFVISWVPLVVLQCLIKSCLGMHAVYRTIELC
jgi:hypothetical protein